MSDEKLSLEGLNFTTINLELKDHIFTITLNRPERKNAINHIMTNELIYALDYAKQERDIRVVVLAASGNVFCAGGDLKAMSGQAGDGPESNVPKRGEIDDMTLKLYHLNKPTIAKIQGPVLAGALLMVCNVTHAIAAEPAHFSAPEILRGLWPFKVMAGLFKVMPRRAGMDFIMRGQRITAERAAQLGLVSEVVAEAELDSRVQLLAEELASLAPGSMQLGLAALHGQEDMRIDEALPYLEQQWLKCLQSEDAKEGIAAFVEKRQPNWQ